MPTNAERLKEWITNSQRYYHEPVDDECTSAMKIGLARSLLAELTAKDAVVEAAKPDSVTPLAEFHLTWHDAATEWPDTLTRCLCLFDAPNDDVKVLGVCQFRGNEFLREWFFGNTSVAVTKWAYMASVRSLLSVSPSAPTAAQPQEADRQREIDDFDRYEPAPATVADDVPRKPGPGLELIQTMCDTINDAVKKTKAALYAPTPEPTP